MRQGADLYRRYRWVADRLTTALIRGSFASFGRRSVIAAPVRLGGEKRIRVGNGVYVGAGSWLQVIAGGGEEHQTDQPAIEIRDGVSISGFVVLSACHRIVLEEHALLARNVYIADHGHRFTDPDTPILAQGIDNIAPVTIGAGSWLGQNVVVMPGATIGAGAVIGANSVVRGDIPPRTVAVGAPARVVRRIEDSSR
ncbi:MAG: acyltransferase [Actinomycetota bacterium]